MPVHVKREVLGPQVGFEGLMGVGSISEVEEEPGFRRTSPVRQVEEVPRARGRRDHKGSPAFDASQQPNHDEHLRQQLAAIEREHARLTEAIATGTERIPILVDRLRAADLKRAELRNQLERTRTASPPPWREIERRMRRRLTEVRSILTGDVAGARQAFREGLLVTPIHFAPVIERGYRAIRLPDGGAWRLFLGDPW